MTALDQKPQVNLARPTAFRMWLVCLCSLAAVLYSALSDGFASLGLALSVLAAALAAEALALRFTNSRVPGAVTDGSAAASALILVLLLPNHLSPLCAVLGVLFAMLLVKFSFGGLGANWVNPALGAWLFIRLSWPDFFIEALGGKVPGNPWNGFPLETGGALDTLLRTVLNKSVFSVTGAELPSGYVDLFLGLGSPGIIADRGLPMLVLGTIALTATQANRAWIPGVYVGVYALLVRIFGALPAGGGVGEGDVLFCLFSGGTLAAAFLVAADPVTGAKTWPGMLIAAVLGGVFAFLFRYLGGELYGALAAAALVNALVPLIRALERRPGNDKSPQK